MNSWEQLLDTYPVLQTILDSALILISLACLLAFAGIYFISATAKIIAVSRKRAIFDKCSRQIALLGLILGWGLLTGSRVWLYLERGTYAQGSVQAFLLEMSWLLLSLGVLFATIYYCLWRILKNMPVLHSTLGMICAVQNCIALLVILFTIRICAGTLPPDANGLALPEMFPEAWNAPLWSAAAYTVPLIFALSGAFSGCWLVLRRKRDDFGRDYYSRMLPWCAAWARNAWAALWLMLLISTSLRIWLQTGANLFDMQEGILDVCRIIAWLVPLPLWTWVMQSRVPMRQSWALFIAFIAAALFVLPYFVELTML